MLRFEGVDLHYGSFRALSGVLHAPRRLVVLLGPTARARPDLMAASGIQSSAGSIGFGDHELVGSGPQIVGAGVARGAQAVPDDVGEEEPHARRTTARKAGIQRSLDEVFARSRSRGKLQNDPAGSLSGGQQQMVAIGRPCSGPSCCCSTSFARSRPDRQGVRGHQPSTSRHHRAVGRAERLLGPGHRASRLRHRARPLSRWRARIRCSTTKPGACRLHRCPELTPSFHQPETFPREQN